LTTHDVTERLALEIQAPLTMRPSEFKPFPAKTNWEVERKKMSEICMQCHGKTWVDDHFIKPDKVVSEYNEVYFKPAKQMLDTLYEKGHLDNTRFFDERLEMEFYELWHHEGRRARMGAAMMAPDYAWWHGFYECKKRNLLYIKGKGGCMATLHLALCKRVQKPCLWTTGDILNVFYRDILLLQQITVCASSAVYRISSAQ